LPGFNVLFVLVILVVPFVVLVEVVVFVGIVVEVVIKLVTKRKGTHLSSIPYEAGSTAAVGLGFSVAGGGGYVVQK
jgi:NADH:ubiquinone oxidoreductase subunit 3 (subunit A)